MGPQFIHNSEKDTFLGQARFGSAENCFDWYVRTENRCRILTIRFGNRPEDFQSTTLNASELPSLLELQAIEYGFRLTRTERRKFEERRLSAERGRHRDSFQYVKARVWTGNNEFGGTNAS